MANLLETVPLPFAEFDAIATERRAEPRSVSGQFAFLRFRPEPDATYQLVRVWNVCTEGVGLFLGTPLKPGTVLYLQFRHMAVQDRVATVAHVTEVEGNWLVGCTLDRAFSSIELRALKL